jgi:hypothetical protein
MTSTGTEAAKLHALVTLLGLWELEAAWARDDSGGVTVTEPLTCFAGDVAEAVSLPPPPPPPHPHTHLKPNPHPNDGELVVQVVVSCLHACWRALLERMLSAPVTQQLEVRAS